VARFKVLYQHLSKSNDEKNEDPVRITSLWIEIRTHDLPNTDGYE
jgi:hypothetical protein